MNKNYQLGLLYLVHLLMSADGVVDENETRALNDIKAKEALVVSYFKQAFDIDFYALRDAAERNTDKVVKG